MYCGEPELTMPPGNSQLDHLHQACGKTVNSRMAAHGADLVPLCWLIPGKAVGICLLLNHKLFQSTTEGPLMHGKGGINYTEKGKNKVRIQEKHSPPHPNMHSSAFLCSLLTFSLVLLLKVFSKSHAVHTVWIWRLQSYRKYWAILCRVPKSILTCWVSANAHQNSHWVFSVHFIAAKSLTWASSVGSKRFLMNNKSRKPTGQRNLCGSYRFLQEKKLLQKILKTNVRSNEDIYKIFSFSIFIKLSFLP